MDLRTVAPIMQQSQVLVGQAIGHDATLQCIVSANPQATVTWSFYDRPLAMTSPKYVTNTGPWYASIYAKTFSLVVDSVTTDDFGAYTCTLANTYGQTQLTIKLVGKYNSNCVCISYLGLEHYTNYSWRVILILS